VRVFTDKSARLLSKLERYVARSWSNSLLSLHKAAGHQVSASPTLAKLCGTAPKRKESKHYLSRLGLNEVKA
jgi:hypothetical protein